jgi:hypothetical protein
VSVTGDLGGDEGLGRDQLVEGTVDTGLLLRVVWARQATGEVAGESPILEGGRPALLASCVITARVEDRPAFCQVVVILALGTDEVLVHLYSI